MSDQRLVRVTIGDEELGVGHYTVVATCDGSVRSGTYTTLESALAAANHFTRSLLAAVRT